MQQCKSKTKNVIFEDEDLRQLEICHNLIKNEHPNPEQDIQCNKQMSMIMDILIMGINTKVTA